MESNILFTVLQILIFLPFIIFLIFLSLKLGGGRLNRLQQGRYIKIIERTHLSKDNSLVVVKLGEKGYVLGNSNGGIEIIHEIQKEELDKLHKEKAIPEFQTMKELYEKMKLKRKDHNEKNQ